MASRYCWRRSRRSIFMPATAFNVAVLWRDRDHKRRVIDAVESGADVFADEQLFLVAGIDIAPDIDVGRDLRISASQRPAGQWSRCSALSRRTGTNSRCWRNTALSDAPRRTWSRSITSVESPHDSSRAPCCPSPRPRRCRPPTLESCRRCPAHRCLHSCDIRGEFLRIPEVRLRHATRQPNVNDGVRFGSQFPGAAQRRRGNARCDKFSAAQWH